MVKITKPAQAGTVESNDIMVTVAPAESGSGIVVELTSPVIKKYGKQICAVIEKTAKDCGIQDALVNANDKGALDCTIEARVKTAIARACAGEAK
ncbi:MAG: citrate lyase acyl carrier protein [Pelosinus sp.]|nr:citrate lyase acyl carrier protein [Pelosinus sp.]